MEVSGAGQHRTLAPHLQEPAIGCRVIDDGVAVGGGEVGHGLASVRLR